MQQNHTMAAAAAPWEMSYCSTQELKALSRWGLALSISEQNLTLYCMYNKLYTALAAIQQSIMRNDTYSYGLHQCLSIFCLGCTHCQQTID